MTLFEGVRLDEFCSAGLEPAASTHVLMSVERCENRVTHISHLHNFMSQNKATSVMILSVQQPQISDRRMYISL
jgi:hypothetical protein